MVLLLRLNPVTCFTCICEIRDTTTVIIINCRTNAYTRSFAFHAMGNNIFKLPDTHRWWMTSFGRVSRYLQRWRKINSGQNARANFVYQNHQSALVTTARMKNSFRVFSSIALNKLRLFAITRMRETFYQVHLVSVVQNTWGYSFTTVYRTLRPFWTADIGSSYQVCQLLSTKLELCVSEGFPLVLRFKNGYLRN
jgi:hypothetical protein